MIKASDNRFYIKFMQLEIGLLVENAEVCDGIDVECNEGADNVSNTCNGRVTSDQRTAAVVEGSINDQIL